MSTELRPAKRRRVHTQYSYSRLPAEITISIMVYGSSPTFFSKWRLVCRYWDSVYRTAASYRTDLQTVYHWHCSMTSIARAVQFVSPQSIMRELQCHTIREVIKFKLLEEFCGAQLSTDYCKVWGKIANSLWMTGISSWGTHRHSPITFAINICLDDTTYPFLVCTSSPYQTTYGLVLKNEDWSSICKRCGVSVEFLRPKKKTIRTWLQAACRAIRV